MKGPHIFFLDGASGAGKTTLALAVASRRSDVSLIPRYTTRPKRADADEREYVFISRTEFDEIKKSDDFVEYRDYDFDMSYRSACCAYRKRPEIRQSCAGDCKSRTNPSCQTPLPRSNFYFGRCTDSYLCSRLIERGIHSEAQLRERLENALSVDQYRDAYDYVLPNVGEPAKVTAELDSIIGDY